MYSKVSEEPRRLQQCFSGLLMKADEDDIGSFSSFSSSHTDSLGSVSSNVLGSISGPLSSAMTSALSLSESSYTSKPFHVGRVEPCIQSSSTCSNSEQHNSLMKMKDRILESIDFEWLRERCDGDEQLVLEVLRSFCEQGQRHLIAMQSSLREFDIKTLIFHSVT